MLRTCSLAWVLACVVLALPAQAQVAVVAHGNPPLTSSGRAVDDTVTAARYGPLEVGLVRGYNVESSAPTYYLRETITGYGTVVNGRAYFSLTRARVEPDGTVLSENEFLVRYDTLRAQVVSPNAEGGESAFRNPCPLDAPLDETTDTDDGACFVTGDYAFDYVFADPISGGPADTLRSQRKSFQYPSYTLTYVADLGYVARDGEFFTERLVYFKGSSGEYGSEHIVTSSEEPARERGGMQLDVHPNPVVGAGTVSIRLDGPAANAEVGVYDALGREVMRLDTGARAGGQHRFEIGGAAFTPGVYIVRANVAGAGREPEVIVRRVTVVR